MVFYWFLVLLFLGMVRNISAQEIVYSSEVYINEFLPNPVGNDSELEFIELYNASSEDINLAGWVLDNGASGDFTIPADISVSAGGYIVFYSAQTGSLLANTGDRRLRLLDSSETVLQEILYSGSKEGYSYNRTDTDTYEQSSLLTPNTANTFPVYPTSTPTPEIIPTPTPSPTPTPTPVISYSADIHVNEFLPNPKGDDATGEFIELINTGSEAVDISEWVLDDVVDSGSAPFSIPDETSIPANGFLTMYRPFTKISLNNDTDHVRLVRPDGIIQDDVVYTSTKEAHSHNRKDGETYELSSTITPDAPNIITTSSSPTPKPTSETEEEKEDSISYDFSSKIVINEFIPNPNGDDTELEFIEIKSLDTRKIRLVGWAIDDAVGGSSPYYFTEADTISPNQILVLFRSKTKIALNNDEDSVQLLDPNKKIISTIIYKSKVIEGQSYNRISEDIFMWSEKATPGKENTIYIQEKESLTPKQKVAKKVTVSRLKTVITPRVLSAVMSNSPLPWPDINVGEKIVTSHFVIESQSPLTGRRGAFVFFGMGVAGMQLLSGIKAKERIWQK